MDTPLTAKLKTQIDRMQQILASVDKPLGRLDGATDVQIAAVESQVGIRFDEHLRSLWRFSDGGLPLVATTDEVTGCEFVSLQSALDAWSWFLPYDQAIYNEWRSDRPCHPRIKPGMFHRLWFPIAEFNGFSTAVYFDADPAPEGKYGQIIAYQHDPDAVYFVADDFLSFVRQSNDLLSTHLTEILFLADEFERICHMKGLAELHRQLSAGLDPNVPNWQRLTLAQLAAKYNRTDIVEFLKYYRPS